MRCLNGGIANKVLSGQIFDYFRDPFIQRLGTIIDLEREATMWEQWVRESSLS